MWGYLSGKEGERSMECSRGSCMNTVSSSRLPLALLLHKVRGRANSFSQLSLGGVQGAGVFQLGSQGSLRNNHSFQLNNMVDYTANRFPLNSLNGAAVVERPRSHLVLWAILEGNFCCGTFLEFNFSVN